MRLDLSVCLADGSECDLRIEARDDAQLADVLGRVRTALSTRPDAPVFDEAGRRLQDSVRLSESGLRNGSRLYLGAPRSGAELPRADTVLAGVRLVVVNGPDAGLVVPLRDGLVVGREPSCGLALSDPDVSREHVRFEVTASGVRIRDLGSTNGTFVDSRPVAVSRLDESALLRIGDSTLQVRSGAPRPELPTPPDEPVEFPSEPSSSQPLGGWSAMLAPALGGVLLAVILHSATYLLLALLSPIAMFATAVIDRAKGRRAGRRQRALYIAELRRATVAVAEGLHAEALRRRQRHPDPDGLVQMVRAGHHDHRSHLDDRLSLRLGLGVLPAEFRVRHDGVSRSAGKLSEVPVGVNLRHNPLNLLGARTHVAGLARWCVVQLAVHSPPTELHIVAILSDPSGWRWLRWLPHVQHAIARTTQSRTAALADVSRLIETRLLEKRGDDPWTGPWTVLLVDTELALPPLADILSRGPAVGVTAICLGTSRPATADGTTVRVAGETGSRITVGTQERPLDQHSGFEDVVADRIEAGFAEDVARYLAALPAADRAVLERICNFDDLHGLAEQDVEDVLLQWKRSDHSPAALVGVAEDAPLCLDLVRDGPHALVAGTTGAGKSELLRSWIAALALSCPPEDVAFVLVDYKGGAAFAECVQLPHTTGLVTDLDHAEVRRVLSSLDAELRRRERLFAQRQVADWSDYRALDPEQPLPRLVVVVDEFAALVNELPGFVSGLVSLAQRGRSLGIHLILATQRPSGVISPEIRANTSLRIALRTVSGADSADILDSPVASGISPALPGRGYAVIDGRRVAFQSAWVGAPATDARQRLAAVTLLDEWREPFQTTPPTAASSNDPQAGLPSGGRQPTQLAQLAALLRRAAERSQRPPLRRPWLAPLPRELALNSLAQPHETGRIAIGIVDLPQEQRQDPLHVALASSIAFVGSSCSGRSTALRAIATAAAATHTPRQMHLHLVDSGGLGELTGLPHVGTAVRSEDADSIQRLVTLLEQQLAAGAVHRLALIVDDWERLCAADEGGQLRLADRLVELARTAPSTGLTLAVGGGRELLTGRAASAFTTRIVLPLGSAEDYVLAGIALRGAPAAPIPGRGLLRDGTELQVAQPAGAALAALTPQHRGDTLPDRIVVRELPSRICLDDLTAPPTGHVVLGVGGDAGEPIVVDLFAGRRRLLVAGPPSSGRATLLRSIASQACRDVRLLIAAPSHSVLGREAAERGWHLLLSARDLPPECDEPTLLLVYDPGAVADPQLGDALAEWLRSAPASAAVVAGRSDDLAVCHRGIAKEVRSARCAVLLQPSSIDGELVGVSLPRRRPTPIAGRGLLVADPAWRDPRPTPIQVAAPAGSTRPY